MNIIPSNFDEHDIPRTVVGGNQKDKANVMNLSVILLNSNGSHFKLNVYENLVKCNFKDIISIEHDPQNFGIDDLPKKFPEIKFIIPLEKATDGELINIAMSEVRADYVLVIRDSLYIPSGIVAPNLAERLLNENIFCIVPRLLDKNKAGLQSLYTPVAEKSHFLMDTSSKVTDGGKTVYPFDNIAIYNRKKFIQLGGFDYTIKTPYWQTLDLAVRSWLWGEQTKITTLLSFGFIEEIPVEDTTSNLDYLRYYLKNEVPRIKNDAAYISSTFFVKFLKHSSCGYLEARRQFKAAVDWVEKNKFNFKTDLPNFVQNWNMKNEE